MKFFALLVCLVMTGVLVTSEGIAAAETPASGVPFETALRDAHALAANRSDLSVVRVEGVSMLPYFGVGAVLVVKKIPFEKLRAGMVVVYNNRFNLMIAHCLISKDSAGWRATGYNNQAADSTLVSADNMVGVVYATFHTNARSANVALNSTEELLPVVLAAPAM